MNRVRNLSYKELDGDTIRRLDTIFRLPKAFVELHPGRVVAFSHYLKVAERISNLQIREDDVWVIAYTRSGSTWTQEMVWLIGNSLDFVGATAAQQVRAPLLELSSFSGHDQENWIKISNSIDFVESKQSPRFIKSHLPFELLPTQIDTVHPKIVYVARDPKDTCVSIYRYLYRIKKIYSSFEDFAELMLEGSVPYGCVWKHMLTALSRCYDPNFLFLRYEDMMKDLRGVIQLTADFLEKPISNEEVTKLVDYLSFSKMRSNTAVNSGGIILKTDDPEFKISMPLAFLRKGEVGDWRNHMSEELAAKFDSKSVDMFRGTGLNYPYKFAKL